MKRGDKVIVLPNKKIGIIDKVEDGFFFLEGSNRPYMRGQLDYHDLNKAVKPILKDMNIYDEAIELVITKVRARESGSIEKTKIIKALERAKKERKLLDVYREQSQAFFDEDIEALRKALTPPTSDEVCKALSEYLHKSLYFNGNQFCVHGDAYGGTVDLNSLPPHLIVLIGRFYASIT